MKASNVTANSKQWEIKSTQGLGQRLAVAALSMLVTICWFPVPRGQGRGCWAGAVDQGARGCGEEGAAALREASLGFASGAGIQPYVWVLCAESWE